jgi:outer membrane PBP1 activator LpoA protein
MIPTTTVAHARRAVAALLLASVACSLRAQVVELPVQAPAPPPAVEATRSIALILPNQQTVFAQSAEAVRLGFFAAHEAAHSTIPIQVIEVDDAAQLHAAIGGAHERGVRVVVGPLLRSEVNAVFEGGYAVVPLVALNYPDRGDSAPPTMIALGLSAEAEAQYVVRVALAEFVGTRRAPSAAPRFVVLSGPGALERRIAQAYVNALRADGEVPTVVDLAVDSGDRLAKLLDPSRHEAVFLALDAGAAAQLRARIPRPIPVFGTSLLNPAAGAATPEATALANDLDGVRFVDMPWLLSAEAAGAVRLRPASPLPAELARLYALGADAYQVAQRWSAGETRFTIEGMTGRLAVNRAAGPRVERTPAAAIYRNGAVEREEIGR